MNDMDSNKSTYQQRIVPLLLYFTELKKYINSNAELAYPHGSAISSLIKMLEEGNIHKIREAQKDDVFQLCAEICFPHMISKQAWRNNHQHVAVSTLITVADEALALLILENNYIEWIEIAKGNEIDRKGERKTKYTHGGVNKDGTKKGWSIEGKNRFNDIFDQCRLSRAKRQSKEREQRIKAIWYDEKPPQEQLSDDNGNEDTMTSNQVEDERYVPRSDFDFE